MEHLISALNAAEMLTSRGAPFSCRGILSANRSEANASVIKLLQAAGRYGMILISAPAILPQFLILRSSKSWSDKDWRKLWSDLLAMRVGGLAELQPSELLAAFVRALLDGGKVSLASSFLAGPDAGLPLLPPAMTEQLVVSVSSQLLRAATSLDHPSVGQARSILTLAPPDAKVR